MISLAGGVILFVVGWSVFMSFERAMLKEL
jgi:hypothetical protein